MSDPRLSKTVTILGALVLAGAFGWWWLVFREVVANDYLTYAQAATCIGAGSDLCTLAQALCTTNHWLGITAYSTVAFWAGLATVSAGLVLRSTQRPV